MGRGLKGREGLGVSPEKGAVANGQGQKGHGKAASMERIPMVSPNGRTKSSGGRRVVRCPKKVGENPERLNPRMSGVAEVVLGSVWGVLSSAGRSLGHTHTHTPGQEGWGCRTGDAVGAGR